jgi:hypothetical protein
MATFDEERIRTRARLSGPAAALRIFVLQFHNGGLKSGSGFGSSHSRAIALPTPICHS